MTHHADPVVALVDRLKSAGFDPRETGPDSWASRCPGHNGSRPNLSIKRGDDSRALVYCHHAPGCSPEAITKALGMGPNDLFPQSPARARPSGNRKAKPNAGRRAYPTPEAALSKAIREYGPPTANWVYNLADGSEAFRLYRFDSTNPGSGGSEKSYRPVHQTPGGWVVGDPPGPLVLYRRTELAAATRVYVTEGEKAADLVAGLGLTAMTSAHGAKSAAKTDWQPLAGLEVVILPDHDPAGEAYAKAVMDRLATVRPSPTVRFVRMPDLWRTDAPVPEGGDVAEWLADGVPEGWGPERCRAEMERLADEARVEDLTAGESPDLPDPPDDPEGEEPERPTGHPTGRRDTGSKYPTLPPGRLVKCVDRDPPNFGYIFEDLGDEARVHFLPGEKGERFVNIGKSDLRNQDGSELTSEHSAVSTDREWPPLRLGELPQVEPFPLDVLPDVMAVFVTQASGAVGCDPVMAAGPLLAIAGGVIGRTAQLALGPNWFASACVYQMTVALPGDGKSPCLNYMMIPANRIDRELAKEFAAEKGVYLEEMEVYEQAMKARKGKNSVGNDTVEKPQQPVPRRLVIDDSTMEACLRTLADNARGLLLCNDELAALLLGMNQYKSKGGNDLPALLKIWTGIQVIIDRVRHELGEPVRIPNPHLCITGNLTPAMLTALTSKRGDLGFLDRWLIAYPDRRPKLKVGQRRPVSDTALAGAERVIRNLWERAMARDDDRAVPHLIQFSEAGKAEFDRLQDLHVDEVNATDFPDALRGYWSKLEEYAARLCLILALMHHAADPSYDPLLQPAVAPAIARYAWRLVDCFKSHHRRVRAALEGKGGVGMPHMAKLVINWINNHPQAASFPQSELTRTYPPSRYDRATLEDGLDWLVKQNAIRRASQPERPPGTPGQKPSPVWEIHPELREPSGESGESGG